MVLKGKRTLGLLAAPLQQELDRLEADGGINWRNAEAALFCIRCSAASKHPVQTQCKLVFARL